jgi:putative DNA primase/helicase
MSAAPAIDATQGKSSLAEDFHRIFAGLRRSYGKYVVPRNATPDENGKLKGIAVTVKEPLTVGLWEQHLAGTIGLGVVPIRDDDSCVFGAIDIDEYPSDHKWIAVAVERAELPLIVCRTKSGGAHCYAFTSGPVPAKLMRSKLSEWASALGCKPGVEIFPKQERLASENDSGSWINIPYAAGARSTRYALKADGSSMTPTEFISAVWKRAITPEALATFELPTDDCVDVSFTGAPPCIQALARKGFGDWQNNGLFNIAVYLRKRFPDTWETALDEYNRQVLTPPVGHADFASTLKSVKKKSYSYMCKQEPICSVCDRQLCLTREFGIGRPKSDTPVIVMDDGTLAMDACAPVPIARALVEHHFSPAGAPTLREYFGDFYEWRASHYTKLDDADITAVIYRFLDAARRQPKNAPFNPKRSDVENVLHALRSHVHLPSRTTPPAWLSGADEDALLVACANGLLRLSDMTLLSHSSDYFNTSALEFAFDPKAATPVAWERFLRSIWDDDVQSISTLQELMGYVVSCDTRHQKMFLLVGPPRSGKGTIARVLTQLVGADGHVGITLASLTRTFGLEPFVGKVLGIVPDARLHGHSHEIIERLLAISGGDALTLDRKFKGAWTGRLSARIVFLTNEVPRLIDSSGAVASRFIVLSLAKSFLGNEDLGLDAKLSAELPAILNWAIDGWRRLQERGYFIQPERGEASRALLNELASPVGSFVKEMCESDPGYSISTSELYEKWRSWCETNGREHTGNEATFGRDLVAARPDIQKEQRRTGIGDERARFYIGVRLRNEAGAKSAARPQGAGKDMPEPPAGWETARPPFGEEEPVRGPRR